MVTTAVVVFAVNILASVLKRWIAPKWGKFGVQVTVFVLALIGAAYFEFGASVAGLQAWVEQGLILFASAVTVYEVILSHIPQFKGSTAPEEA